MVFRRMSSKSPINSRKHVIDASGGLVAGTQSTVDLIDVVDSSALTSPTQNNAGSRVNSLFLNIQVAASGTGGIPNVYMAIYKNPGNNIAAANVPMADNVGISDFKKMIFHQEMIMTEENTTAIARTLFKGVLKIPRHFRRNGSDDKTIIILFSPNIAFEWCLQCIYKEYR